MAFDKYPISVATSIPTITIKIKHTGKDENDNNLPIDVTFALGVHDQDDMPMRNFGGDLKPHISQNQLNAIQTFMDDLREQAELEVLTV